MRIPVRWTVALLVIASLPQAHAAPPAPPPPACGAPEYRQFDFWAGEWTVYGKDGTTVVGHSRVERSADGCRLLENWTSTSGFTGQSLNGWDAPHGVWRQFWIGGDGAVLRLEGGLRDGAMRMDGTLPAQGGGVQRQRISWTPQPDGSVIQHWEVSDDGSAWTTSFRGTYRRKHAP